MIESTGNKIGVWEASAYCLGDIIGSGIFVSPSSILNYTGSLGLAICVWIASALIAGVGALVYVELGTSIRRSGCDFAYLNYVGWHPIAVAFLWVSAMFTYPTILAIQTLAFGEYILQGLDNFLCLPSTREDGTGQMWLLQRLVGFVALLLISFLNMFSLRKFAGRFQVIVTASKLTVITLIVLTGFYYIIFKGRTAAFDQPFANSKMNGDLVMGLFAGLYAYNGWDILNFGAEEIENPRRTLPIAVLFSLGVSALVYVLVNVAYFSVLSIPETLASDAVAAKFAEYTLGDFAYVVPFLVGILLLGNFNTTIFGCSRYMFAGARRNVVPTALKCAHSSSASPRAAVALATFLAICLTFAGDLDHLIGYMSFAMWLQRSFTMCALLYMRHQRWVFPADAFRTHIAMPITFLVICLSLLVVSVRNNPHIILYGGSIVVAGLIIYFVFIFPDALPAFVHDLNERTVIFTQISLNVMPFEENEAETNSRSGTTTIGSTTDLIVDSKSNGYEGTNNAGHSNGAFDRLG